MNSLFSFCYFNLFSEPKEEAFSYILFLGLCFDFFFYSTFFFHTIFFCFLYFFNRRIIRCVHCYTFVLKGILNLSIGLFVYALYTEHLSYLSFLWPSYFVNILFSIFIYFFRKRRIVLRHT